MCWYEEDWVAYMGAGLLVVLLFAGLGYIAYSAQKQCEARGGHQVTHSGFGVGIGDKGSVVPVVTSETWCVSDDGRVLE